MNLIVESLLVTLPSLYAALETQAICPVFSTEFSPVSEAEMPGLDPGYCVSVPLNVC